MKRQRLTALLLALPMLLSGCGSIFETEYYAEEDYVFTVQEAAAESEKVTVRNFSGLKRAIQSMVYAGAESGTIAFDSSYEGSGDDLPNACWQVRTQDALCAYCVQDIQYELSRIVTHDEAEVHIRYAQSAASVGEVLQLSYATGVDAILRQALEDNRDRVVILVSNSSYSADRMRRLVTEVYRTNPICSVAEPQAEVYMYSGSGMQRLYEIDLSSSLSEDEIIRRKAQLKNLDVPGNLDAASLTPPQAALAAVLYLLGNCSYKEAEGINTVYDALIRGEANSEGLALAYVEMCRQLEINCTIVYGQLAWEDHCWNIIELEGERYHVDVSACILEGIESGFLRSDESMWLEYRWDTSAYEPCSGSLSYWEVSGMEPTMEPKTPEEKENVSAEEQPEPIDAVELPLPDAAQGDSGEPAPQPT